MFAYVFIALRVRAQCQLPIEWLSVRFLSVIIAQLNGATYVAKNSSWKYDVDFRCDDARAVFLRFVFSVPFGNETFIRCIWNVGWLRYVWMCRDTIMDTKTKLRIKM